MKFESILDLGPIVHTESLLDRGFDPKDVFRQLCRWVDAGKLHPLRRGLYALALPYEKARPHPFFIANSIEAQSYVSTESALSFHGLTATVPSEVTSVTTNRPGRFATPLGNYAYHYVNPRLFGPFREIEVGGLAARVAAPEKALLDWVHLRRGGDTPRALEALRLQNLDALDFDRLSELALASGKPKLKRAVEWVLGGTLSKEPREEAWFL